MSASNVTDNVTKPDAKVELDVQKSIVDPFVDDDIPGTLDSSGGSSELKASHLQLSTVTFTGVPSSPSCNSIPPPEAAFEHQTAPVSTSNPVDVACKYSFALKLALMYLVFFENCFIILMHICYEIIF